MPIDPTVIETRHLADRFEDLVERSRRVDIATAWVTMGRHLEILRRGAEDGVRFRVIVGTHGNATDPDALAFLHGLDRCELRLVRGAATGIFHPKLYLFHLGRPHDRAGGSIALTGSANFTNGGFSSNEELMLEVGHGQEADGLIDWFEKRWSDCGSQPKVGNQIHNYRRAWQRPEPEVGTLVEAPVDGLWHLCGGRTPRSIAEYEAALLGRERELAADGVNWCVLGLEGSVGSYQRAIQERGEAVKAWLGGGDIRQSERLIRGLGEEWMGLVGRMTRLGPWHMVLRHEADIRHSLLTVLEAADQDFPDVAVSALDDISGHRRASHGTATLLLTLTRPDRCICVNNASEQGLAELTGIPRTKLGWPADEPGNGYGKLLGWLYRQPWYNVPEPGNRSLVGIWRMRAALLDAFVYRQ
ncbi:MAG: phospholipase D-like domain-containing protein [Gemmatimonadetes bacterium]|nr:phospholipase D-like domain-containing protein [Gemmatimonadota bacterium]